MLPYRPYRWLRNGHLQTIMAGLAPGQQPTNRTQALPVDLDDGEQLLVHEELGEPLTADAPLAILVHGLGGDHSAPYLQRIAFQLRRRNCRCWRVDLRGSGLGMELAWRPAHAGASHDLVAIIARARQLYPNTPLMMVGFSLSGNILLKALGELAAGLHALSLDEANIQQAISVAPPLDLNDCADNMDRLSRNLYTRYYLKNLQELAERKRELWPQWRQLPTEPSVKTIRQFDARYTAPLAGFRDTADYYDRSSSLPWLPKVRTITEILLDRHDPIVTWSSHLKATYDPNWVRFSHTSYGGHMGYFGMDDQGQMIRWLEYYIVQRLSLGQQS